MLTSEALKEWVEGSGVDEAIVRLNVEFLEGYAPFEHLLYNWESGKVHPDAINREINRRFGDNWFHGGWWCSGVNILTGEDSRWGCFKPHKPRTDKSKGFDPNKPKLIKYEHPPKTATEIFALRITWQIGLKIAQNQGFENEYQQRIFQAQEQIATEKGEEASQETPAELFYKPYKEDQTGEAERESREAAERTEGNGNPNGTDIHSGVGGVAPSSHKSGIQAEAFPHISDEFLKLEDSHFWQWVQENPTINIIWTEGAKKAGALLTAGYAAIALPGIRNGYRQPRDEFGNKIGLPHLIPQLQVFAQEGREIYFCFDQDSKQKTVRDVNLAISSTAKLLNKQGCQVNIISWDGRLGKGVDDLIITHGQEAFDFVYQNADSFEVWQVKQSQALTYAIDLELNSRYLGDFAPPPNRQLMGLKAPKGTGKTHLLARLVEPLLQTGERRVLLVTHRIQLGEELSRRIGVDWVTDVAEGTGAGGIFGVGLCIDSLHPESQARFNPRHWEGAWLILDEVEQLIWHVLNSSTCQEYRVKILRCLKETIQIILQTGGKIFISDADLSDTAIDFIRALAGYDLKPWVVTNNWKPEKGWTVYKYGGNNPASTITAMEKAIANGDKLFVCLSGQRKKSQWGTQNLESHLRRKFPELRILRIDRESIADPEHPAYGCMGNLNESLPLYDVVLASPTIETGVSIDCDHFTSVWGIFQGVQSCDSVRQALARVRANIPRHIWVRGTGFSRVGNGSTSIKALLASQHRLTKANINLLMQSGFDEDIDQDFQPESLITWAKKAAAVNLGMGAYRETVLKALEEEGHTLIDAEEVDEAEAESVKDEVRESKDIGYQGYCEAIANTESPHDHLFEQLEEKRAKTESERLQSRKGELERRYRVPVTPELVAKDENHWHSQIRLHYYLMAGRPYLSIRDANIMRRMLEKGEGGVFKPDVNRSMLGAKVAALDWLGFHQLLEQRDFSNEDEVVRTIAEKAKANSFDLRAVLGVSISQNDSPMAIAQRLVGLIGYSFPCLKRISRGDERVRIYGPAAAGFEKDEEGKLVKDANEQAVSVCDGRDAVFAAWIERDVAAQEQVTAPSPSEEKVRGVDSAGEGLRPGVINKIYISSLDAGGVDVTEGVDAEVVEALAAVATPDEFSQAIRGLPSEAVEDAIASQDTQPRRQQLSQWYEQMEVVEDAIATRPHLENYQPGQEVWAFFPQSCDGWLKGVVEWVRGHTVRVKSGFFGAFIESPEAIAPGDWVMSG